MQGILTITTDESQWSAMVKKFASAALITEEQAFQEQGVLLAKELMERTPPFSGKTVRKMLEAQGKTLHDADIESLSAKLVGERRVEKDIRKVIYGVRGATMPQPERPLVAIAQAHPGNAGYDPENVEWGVLQKCEGKQAVRIFATRSGEVYGVDYERFKANATMDELAATHKQHRGKRGRVTTAGRRDKIVGRWRWLNVLATNETVVAAFIALKKKMVGQAKGGWAAAYMAMGGKLSPKGWVGRHAKSGLCEASFQRGNIRIVMVNQSAWASNGDPDRIIAKSLEGRERAIEGRIARELEKRWGAGGNGDFLKPERKPKAK